METEVNRGCRMVLWALANKWESADICTPSELRKREREGETRETERLQGWGGGGVRSSKKKGSGRREKGEQAHGIHTTLAF